MRASWMWSGKAMAADYGFEWMPLSSYPLPSDALVVLVARSGEDRVFDSLSEKCGVWNSETQMACACYELGLGNPLSPQEDEGESLTDWMLTERYDYGQLEFCFESSPAILDAEVCNPILADIFHELNLAEEKGTGIRRMRKMMEAAHLAAPMFESDRDANKFTIRLLLHHFLGEEDLRWLSAFDRSDLDDNQKKAMIFLRETGAVDNSVYRQFSGVDTLRASSALRKLRECGLVMQKGKGSATYYVAGEEFPIVSETLQGSNETLIGNGKTLIGNDETLIDDPTLGNEVKALKKRVARKYLEDIVVRMCRIRPFRAEDLSRLLKRNETYLHEILTALVKSKRLMYTIPEMPTHPNQMYRAND